VERYVCAFSRRLTRCKGHSIGFYTRSVTCWGVEQSRGQSVDRPLHESELGSSERDAVLYTTTCCSVTTAVDLTIHTWPFAGASCCSTGYLAGGRWLAPMRQAYIGQIYLWQSGESNPVGRYIEFSLGIYMDILSAAQGTGIDRPGNILCRITTDRGRASGA
jgi:hypothetical protein